MIFERFSIDFPWSTVHLNKHLVGTKANASLFYTPRRRPPGEMCVLTLLVVVVVVAVVVVVVVGCHWEKTKTGFAGNQASLPRVNKAMRSFHFYMHHTCHLAATPFRLPGREGCLGGVRKTI